MTHQFPAPRPCAPRDTLQPTQSMQTALLIDGDNISADRAGQILRAISTLANGIPQPSVKRVFGGLQGLRNWQASHGFDLIYAGAKSKNAADIRMTMDAMEMAYSGSFDSFVLCSNDADFSLIAHWLRARGHKVIGLGLPTASDVFRSACTCFHMLKDIASAKPQIDPRIADAITALRLTRMDKPMLLATFGQTMNRQYHHRANDLPGRGWHAFLSNHGAPFQINKRDGKSYICLTTG